MGAIEKMMCVVCVSVTEGHSLCMYELRKGDLFVLSWATSEEGNDLFRAAETTSPHDMCVHRLDSCLRYSIS